MHEFKQTHFTFRQLYSAIPPRGAASGQPSYVTEIIEFQNVAPFVWYEFTVKLETGHTEVSGTAITEGILCV
jgi:hypothetical protein